jgi:LacI family transcriptional regulator
MAKKKNVTITDVAKLAGVSVATVSVVINKKDKYVSPELRARVEDAVEALNYRPNLLARSLKVKETNTIGLIFPNITSPVMPPLVRTVQKVAQKAGFDTFIVITEENYKLERTSVPNLVSKRVDGLIICPVLNEDYSHILNANKHLPVISIERKVPHIDCVVTNNFDTAYRAASHLLEVHGHRRIGFITMPIFGSNTQERIDGYKQAMQEHQCYDPDLVRETDYTGQSAFHQAQDLLFRYQLDAIFTASQSIAQGAFKAAIDLGLRIPDDVAIMGYDDLPWMELVSPSLSTTRQPIVAIASKACDILFERLDGMVQPPQTHYIDSELVIRASCGCSPEG